jgi:transposase
VAYNFLTCERDQQYLMPPSLTEWLPEDHLAWFVLDAVEQMDLSDFYAGYRDDGWGRAAHDPAMMVALLLYAYCLGVRSSRQIERACHVDVAFRVIAANHCPDHTTIARFRARHEAALAKVFTQSLRLCAEAGMAKVGVVALDGTKMAAPAALDANRTKAHIDAEVEAMLAEAAEVDATEDRLFGPEASGDEPPAALRGKAARRARLEEAKARLDAEAAGARAAHEQHLAARAAKEEETGKKLRGRKPKAPSPSTEAKANTSDPDSRIMKDKQGYLQGYNAQAVVNDNQLVLAAEVTDEAADVAQLHPMIEATKDNLDAAGLSEEPEVVLADAGYWSESNATVVGPDGPELLVATTKDWKQKKAAREAPSPRGRIPKNLSVRDRMERKLLTKKGRALYAKRSPMVEPVFGQTKEARGARRFMRRGKQAADSEWKLLCGTHNLLKLFRRAAITPSAAPWARLHGGPGLALSS